MGGSAVWVFLNIVLDFEKKLNKVYLFFKNTVFLECGKND